MGTSATIADSLENKTEHKISMTMQIIKVGVTKTGLRQGSGIGGDRELTFLWRGWGELGCAAVRWRATPPGGEMAARRLTRRCGSGELGCGRAAARGRDTLRLGYLASSHGDEQQRRPATAAMAIRQRGRKGTAKKGAVARIEKDCTLNGQC
ncbi:hypothetical protein NL676_003253 [Syzygium grande]|nr:hypothetical protein NL676_003253 [Syzygium grande]